MSMPESVKAALKEAMRQEVADAVAAEREACAAIADAQSKEQIMTGTYRALRIAAAIRARGEK